MGQTDTAGILIFSIEYEYDSSVVIVGFAVNCVQFDVQIKYVNSDNDK